MTSPKTYHWLLLSGCAAVGFIAGCLNLISGASPASRFAALDRILVRVLGVALVVFSPAVFLGESWAMLGLTLCFGLSIAEILLTHRLTASSPAQARREMFAVAAVTLIIFGIPLALLLWLRPVFTIN